MQLMLSKQNKNLNILKWIKLEKSLKKMKFKIPKMALYYEITAYKIIYKYFKSN